PVFLRFGIPALGGPVILSTTRFAVGETDEPAARRSKGRPSPASRGDHQPAPSAVAACGEDRREFSGATLPFGMSGGARAAAVADVAGGRAVHFQAYAQPLRRGGVRAMGGEPSTSVGKWCSGTSCHLIARRSRAGASG